MPSSVGACRDDASRAGRNVRGRHRTQSPAQMQAQNVRVATYASLIGNACAAVHEEGALCGVALLRPKGSSFLDDPSASDMVTPNRGQGPPGMDATASKVVAAVEEWLGNGAAAGHLPQPGSPPFGQTARPLELARAQTPKLMVGAGAPLSSLSGAPTSSTPQPTSTATRQPWHRRIEAQQARGAMLSEVLAAARTKRLQAAGTASTQQANAAAFSAVTVTPETPPLQSVRTARFGGRSESPPMAPARASGSGQPIFLAYDTTLDGDIALGRGIQQHARDKDIGMLADLAQHRLGGSTPTDKSGIYEAMGEWTQRPPPVPVTSALPPPSFGLISLHAPPVFTGHEVAHEPEPTPPSAPSTLPVSTGLRRLGPKFPLRASRRVSVTTSNMSHRPSVSFRPLAGTAVHFRELAKGTHVGVSTARDEDIALTQSPQRRFEIRRFIGNGWDSETAFRLLCAPDVTASAVAAKTVQLCDDEAEGCPVSVPAARAQSPEGRSRRGRRAKATVPNVFTGTFAAADAMSAAERGFVDALSTMRRDPVAFARRVLLPRLLLTSPALFRAASALDRSRDGETAPLAVRTLDDAMLFCLPISPCGIYYQADSCCAPPGGAKSPKRPSSRGGLGEQRAQFGFGALPPLPFESRCAAWARTVLFAASVPLPQRQMFLAATVAATSAPQRHDEANTPLPAASPMRLRRAQAEALEVPDFRVPFATVWQSAPMSPLAVDDVWAALAPIPELSEPLRKGLVATAGGGGSDDARLVCSHATARAILSDSSGLAERVSALQIAGAEYAAALDRAADEEKAARRDCDLALAAHEDPTGKKYAKQIAPLLATYSLQLTQTSMVAAASRKGKAPTPADVFAGQLQGLVGVMQGRLAVAQQRAEELAHRVAAVRLGLHVAVYVCDALQRGLESCEVAFDQVAVPLLQRPAAQIPPLHYSRGLSLAARDIARAIAHSGGAVDSGPSVMPDPTGVSDAASRYGHLPVGAGSYAYFGRWEADPETAVADMVCLWLRGALHTFESPVTEEAVAPASRTEGEAVAVETSAPAPKRSTNKTKPRLRLEIRDVTQRALAGPGAGAERSGGGAAASSAPAHFATEYTADVEKAGQIGTKARTGAAVDGFLLPGKRGEVGVQSVCGCGWQRHPHKGAVAVLLVAPTFQESAFVKKLAHLPLSDAHVAAARFALNNPHAGTLPSEVHSSNAKYDLCIEPAALGIKTLTPKTHPIECGATAAVYLDCPPHVVLSCDLALGADPLAGSVGADAAGGRLQRAAHSVLVDRMAVQRCIEAGPERLEHVVAAPRVVTRIQVTLPSAEEYALVINVGIAGDGSPVRRGGTVILQPQPQWWASDVARAHVIRNFPSSLDVWQTCGGQLLAPRDRDAFSDTGRCAIDVDAALVKDPRLRAAMAAGDATAPLRHEMLEHLCTTEGEPLLTLLPPDASFTARDVEDLRVGAVRLVSVVTAATVSAVELHGTGRTGAEVVQLRMCAMPKLLADCSRISSGAPRLFATEGNRALDRTSTACRWWWGLVRHRGRTANTSGGVSLWVDGQCAVIWPV